MTRNTARARTASWVSRPLPRESCCRMPRSLNDSLPDASPHVGGLVTLPGPCPVRPDPHPAYLRDPCRPSSLSHSRRRSFRGVSRWGKPRLALDTAIPPDGRLGLTSRPPGVGGVTLITLCADS